MLVSGWLDKQTAKREEWLPYLLVWAYMGCVVVGIEYGPWGRPAFIPEPYAAWIDLALAPVVALGALGIILWAAFLLLRQSIQRIRNRKALVQGVAWLLVVPVLVAFTLAFSASKLLTMAMVYDEVTREPSHVVLVPGGKGVEVRGPIVDGLAVRLELLLKDNPGVEVVHLSSQGGVASEGGRLRDVIRAHGLATYVPDLCASACTDAFAGGRERFLKEGASLGYHAARNWLFGDLFGRDTRNTFDALVAAGLPADFAARAQATPNDDIWLPEPAELLKAGAVTAEVEADRFPSPDRKAKLREDRRALVMAMELAFLSRPDLGAFTDWSDASADKGWSLEARRDVLQGYVSQAILRRVLKAPDAVAVEAGAFLLEAMEQAEDDERLCNRIGAGDIMEAMWALQKADPGARQRLRDLLAKLQGIQDIERPVLPPVDKPQPPRDVELKPCEEVMASYISALEEADHDAAPRIKALLSAGGNVASMAQGTNESTDQ